MYVPFTTPFNSFNTPFTSPFNSYGAPFNAYGTPFATPFNGSFGLPYGVSNTFGGISPINTGVVGGQYPTLPFSQVPAWYNALVSTLGQSAVGSINGVNPINGLGSINGLNAISNYGAFNTVPALNSFAGLNTLPAFNWNAVASTLLGLPFNWNAWNGINTGAFSQIPVGQFPYSQVPFLGQIPAIQGIAPWLTGVTNQTVPTSINTVKNAVHTDAATIPFGFQGFPFGFVNPVTTNCVAQTQAA